LNLDWLLLAIFLRIFVFFFTLSGGLAGVSRTSLYDRRPPPVASEVAFRFRVWVCGCGRRIGFVLVK
jgi:hypothetical protein